MYKTTPLRLTSLRLTCPHLTTTQHKTTNNLNLFIQVNNTKKQTVKQRMLQLCIQRFLVLTLKIKIFY